MLVRGKCAEQHIYAYMYIYNAYICTQREAKVQLTTVAAIVLVTTGRQEFWLVLEDKSIWWYLKAEVLVTSWSTWGKSSFGV